MTKELSEQFKQALKDLTDAIVEDRGLAQDITPEDHFRTLQALIAKLMYVGLTVERMTKYQDNNNEKQQQEVIVEQIDGACYTFDTADCV